MDKYATDIEQINGNEYFDAAIGGTMGIVSVDMSIDNQGVTFNSKDYEKCEDISLTSNDEYINKFVDSIEQLLIKDNLLNHVKYNPKATQGIDKKNHYEYNPNDNWYVIQLPRVRGNKDRSTNEVKTDFYTLISNNVKFISRKVLGTYKELDPLYYIPFDDKKERNNCFKYLQTYFVRSCLIKCKMNIELLNNPHLRHIPWFDFSDPIFDGTPEEIDMALFKKYNIRQEIIDHILEILPNYYDLDLDKYKG